MKRDRVKSTESPFIGNVLAIQTGLYSLNFSNQYSWFISKDIKFRVQVLTPSQVQLRENEPLEKILYPLFVERERGGNTLDHPTITGKVFVSVNRAIIVFRNERSISLFVSYRGKQSEVELEDSNLESDLIGPTVQRIFEFLESRLFPMNNRQYILHQI